MNTSRILAIALASACVLTAQIPVGGGGGGGGGGRGVANHRLAITTTSTSWSVDAATHKNSHSALIVHCFTSAGAAMARAASSPSAGQFSYTVNATTYLVSITFGSGGNNGGWCTINGSGQGLPGPTGPQGDPGPAGEDGEPGTAATITVGTVTTGEPGTDASVTNVGTANTAVFDFVIPRGADGTGGGGGGSVTDGDKGDVIVSGSGATWTVDTLPTSRISGLDAALAALPTTYAPIDHDHAIADVTGLQTAIEGKASTSHNHDGTYAPAAQGVTGGNAHDHNGGDGGQIAYSSLSGAPTLGDAAAKNTGTTAGTVAAGNDSRIVNAAQIDAAGYNRIANILTTFHPTEDCNEEAEVGRIALRKSNPGTAPDAFKVCAQTGSSSYGWINVGQARVLTSAPTSCSVGEMIVRSDQAPEDGNVYVCKQTNGTWVKVSSGSGGAVTSVDGRTGVVTLSDLYAPITHTSATSNPHSVTKAQVGLGSVENYAIASQAEAEAGTATDKYMTPQRVAQAIAELASQGGGSGNMTMQAVTGANPSGACTPGQDWRIRTDVSPATIWYCNSSGTYRTIPDTSGIGPYRVTGEGGTVPSPPATSGDTTVWFDTEAKVPKSIHSDGTIGRMITESEYTTITDSDLIQIATLECEEGEIPKRIGGAWSCAPDNNDGEGSGSGTDLPSPFGYTGAIASTDGSSPLWSWKLAIPSGGSQAITGTGSQINAARMTVDVDPDGTYTLGDGTNPVIVDGSDGQILNVTNIDTALTLTLADEANVANSNISCGGSNVAIGPQQTVSLRFSSSLSTWSCVGSSGNSSSSGITANDVRTSVFQCAGTSGNDNYECSIPGVSEYTTNMLIYFVADSSSSTTGGTSLNVNGLGSKNVYETNGTLIDHDGAITAGRGYWLRYDGTQFRLDGSAYAQHAYRSTAAGSGILKQSVLGTFSIASAGSDYVDPAGLAAAIGAITSINGTTIPASSTLLVVADKNANNGVAGLDGNARLEAARMPAFTGDVTTSAGAVATTLAAKHRTRVAHFKLWGTGTDYVLQDTDDELSVFNNRLGSGITITDVACESDAGTPTIMLQRDDGTPANILAGNLTCTTSVANTTSFSGTENQIANGHRIDALVVAAGGTAKWVAVTITYTVD